MILAVKNFGNSHHTSVVGDCAHIPCHTLLALVSAQVSVLYVHLAWLTAIVSCSLI